MKIAVAGIGLVTPFGACVQANADCIRAGKSTVHTMRRVGLEVAPRGPGLRPWSSMRLWNRLQSERGLSPAPEIRLILAVKDLAALFSRPWAGRKDAAIASAMRG